MYTHIYVPLSPQHLTHIPPRGGYHIFDYKTHCKNLKLAATPKSTFTVEQCFKRTLIIYCAACAAKIEKGPQNVQLKDWW